MTRRLDDIERTVHDDPAADHAEIRLTPGPVLWRECPGDFPAATTELEAESVQHALLGLLARLVVELEPELDLERLQHGCERAGWYAVRNGDHDNPRLLRAKFKLAAGEVARRGYSDHCCASMLVELHEELLDRCLYVTVPRRRLAFWRRRVAELLDELAASVPQ